eukprot:scaffold9519_cov128-Isochrysis_galbana.AAC.2
MQTRRVQKRQMGTAQQSGRLRPPRLAGVRVRVRLGPGESRRAAPSSYGTLKPLYRALLSLSSAPRNALAH